jgi:hypothetical protein
MAKRALCVGVNRYPRPELGLNGCVNDAKGWAALLNEHYDFTRSDIELITDSRATKACVRGGLENLLTGARRGDVLVFTNSSHGTYRADENGDESVYDEALCPYDCEDELLVDDELRELFADIPWGVRLTVISDSCHSGSATRDPEDPFAPDRRRRRFCDPRSIGRPALSDIRRTSHPRSAELYPERDMRELLLSGCRSDQYSYDAKFGRTFHGAMSIFAQNLIAQAGYRITYRQLHRRLVPALRDANYEQEPLLEGRDYFKRQQVFT